MSAFITATGLVTAVGIGTGPACAAMRAGIKGFTELPYVDDEQQTIIGAPVPPLGWSSTAIERAAILLRSAVVQVTHQLDPRARERLAVVFAGCELDRPVVDEGRAQWLAAVAAQALGTGPMPARVLVVRGGAPASFRALAVARELLSTKDALAVMVCSVDSLLDARSLSWLSRARPLRSVRRSDGAVPGEAAVALLLRPGPDRDHGRGLLVAGLGVGDEPSDRSVEVPRRADGLVNAIRTALGEAGLGLHELDLRLASGAHGSSESKEQALALTRILRERVESFPLWLSAETLGDVGTTAGLLAIAWTHDAGLRGYLPGRAALATAMARDGERAAAVLRWVGAGRC
ncbi:MAG: hypothetical protein R6X02_05415 [Enhygromyxa sp.]